MKIVWLAPFAYSPKATVSARMMPMATALARRGHDITILIPPYDNPGDSGKVWEQDKVRVENASLSRWPVTSYRLLSMAWQLARRVRRLRPDIVHVFKPVGPSALAMWLLRKDEGRRMKDERLTDSSFILHPSYFVDNDDWEGNGGWLDVNPYPALQRRVMRWQERWCLRRALAVTCASQTLQERTRLLAGAHCRTALMPNGPDNALRGVVSRAEACRQALRDRFGWAGKRVVIYAGTVPLNHDMDVAARAVLSARSAMKNATSLRWVIVATGDGLPSLRATICQMGLDADVEYHDFMSHDRLVERLVAADIALYPYRDTNINRAKCSGKVIDYMACGLPMVVSDVGMNRVYLEDGVSGLLTPPGDAGAFAAALGRLAHDPAWARQLGRAAQRRLWEQFGWDGRIGALEDLYQSAR